MLNIKQKDAVHEDYRDVNHDSLCMMDPATHIPSGSKMNHKTS